MNTTRRISTMPLLTTQKELKWTVRIKILTPNCTATERQHILIWVRSCNKHVEHLKPSYTAIFVVWTFDILKCKTFPLSFRRISLLAGFFRLSTLTKSVAQATILVTNLETLEWFPPSLMLIWVLQSSHCFKIRVAQHWGRRGANLSENEGVRSECKKFGENSRQMAPVSTICDEYCSYKPMEKNVVRNLQHGSQSGLNFRGIFIFSIEN